ncbi:MAG: FecR family protein [Bacteroidales bacterium]
MPDDNIHIILAKYFNKEATKEELKLIEEWKAVKPVNQQEFLQLKKLHEICEDSKKYSDMCFDVDKAWSKVNSRTTRTSPIALYRWLAAVIVVGLLITAFFTYRSYNLRHTWIEKMASVDRDAITLPDSSIVTLRKGAKISYLANLQNNNLRNVKLEGDAFFEVEHKELQPFIVSTSIGKVEVLGTKFMINQCDSVYMKVAVRQGKVRFSVKNDSVDKKTILEAGDLGVYHISKDILNKQKNISESTFIWLNKSLEFKNLPLSVVFSDVENYFDIKLVVNDSSILQKRFTARFNDPKLSTFFTSIETAYGLNVSAKEANVYIID